MINPRVGLTVVTSSFIIRLTMVVLPALSRPLQSLASRPERPDQSSYSINIRISLSFKRAFRSMDNMAAKISRRVFFWESWKGKNLARLKMGFDVFMDRPILCSFPLLQSDFIFKYIYLNVMLVYFPLYLMVSIGTVLDLRLDVLRTSYTLNRYSR